MKVRYDPARDTMVITLPEGPIRESDELGPGVIADFGEDGSVVRCEILDASKRVDDPFRVTERARWLCAHLTREGDLLRNPDDEDRTRWVTIQVDSKVFDADKGNEATGYSLRSPASGLETLTTGPEASQA